MRLHAIILVLSLPVLLAGSCDGEFFGGPRPCDCPNTEAMVPTIDWFGDGTAPDDAVYTATDLEAGPHVSLLFADFATAEEARAALDSLIARLEAAGLVFVTIGPDEREAEIDGAIVSLFAPFLAKETETEINIAVRVTAGDAATPAVLQPLVDALGALD